MTTQEIIEKVRELGKQPAPFGLTRLAPEAGGIKSVMRDMPAENYLQLAAAVGNDNDRILQAMADNTQIDGMSFTRDWYAPRPEETLSQWSSRIGLWSLDELDTTPRAEDPNSGLLNPIGPDLNSRLYKLIG